MADQQAQAPAPAPAPAPAAAQPAPGHAAPQSEMQKDKDHWVGRLNTTMKDPSPITDPKGSAEWSSGFFECFNPVDLCLMTWCCPCVTFGKTHHILHKGDVASWSPVNLSCLAFIGASCIGCHCVANLMQRSDIRETSNPKLKGDFITDLLKAWCCNCCDLVQQEKEAEALLAKGALSHQVAEPGKVQQMTYSA